MVKRYKLFYKKMHKKRIQDHCLIFFQNWGERVKLFFKHTFLIFFYRTSIIKLKFVRRFKKRFRKPFRRKRLYLLFFCKPNYLVHQKFKNARMGKGKGSPTVWVYKPLLNRPVAIMGGVNRLRAESVMKFFRLYFIPWMYIKVIR